MNAHVNLRQRSSKVFWGEISPCEHFIQIYEEDEVFLDTLEGFVRGGIDANDGIILIATPAHLNALEKRLLAQGVDLEAARAADQYLAFDAEEFLAKFMVNGWPDEKLFKRAVMKILASARGKHWRRVRAFGEMVAVLWAQGHNGATIQLEHIWEEFCKTERFSVFCAYPKSGFTQDATKSLQEICATHSHTIAGGVTA